MIVKKVLERKDGIKMVIVPKNCSLKKDDLVQIIKMEENTNGKRREDR